MAEKVPDAAVRELRDYARKTGSVPPAVDRACNALAAYIARAIGKLPPVEDGKSSARLFLVCGQRVRLPRGYGLLPVGDEIHLCKGWIDLCQPGVPTATVQTFAYDVQTGLIGEITDVVESAMEITKKQMEWLKGSRHQLRKLLTNGSN